MAINWDEVVIAPTIGIFGETVIYAPSGGAPSFTLTGVFDAGFTQTQLLGPDGPDFSDSDPMLGLRLADFPPGAAPAQNDGVMIAASGVAYVVTRVRPDGKGWVRLDLNLADDGAGP
jgi:hypothetical protein